MQLRDELAKFRLWAETRDPALSMYSSGEWECDYPHWPEMYEAVRAAMQSEVKALDPHEILFVLARDNEDEIVLGLLANHPAIALHIAPSALTFPDREARWQMAVVLGRIGGNDVGQFLASFANDSDEYVRRRALQSQVSAGS